MTTIDIRKDKETEIKSIKVADNNEQDDNLVWIKRGYMDEADIELENVDVDGSLIDEPVWLSDDWGETYLRLDTADDALALINGLEFALKNGWWK